MLALRHHDSLDYAKLPDIDATDAGIITSDDQACLDEIGSTLLRSRFHERFGTTLLHSHFPIGDHETLLEEVCLDERAITLRPVCGQPFDVFATNVCFDDAHASRGGLRLVGLEFATRQALGGAASIGSSDHDVLTSVTQILQGHGKTKRFGIRLLHDPLRLGGTALLETCDSLQRILRSRSEAESPATVRSIPTVFRWEEAWASEDGLAVDQGCMQFCRTVSRCEQPVRGSHSRTRNHEPTGHESI